MTATAPDLAALAAAGKASLARTLAALETEDGRRRLRPLLDAAFTAPGGRVLGLTGPPGVGKSTLLSALIAAFRARGETVAVVAVDPSSGRTRGALLGDRVRLVLDPDDTGTFVRSLAAGRRLGGLADAVVPFVVVLRALFDVTIVETVGVGQSETEIGQVADTAVLVVQPAAGDSLQFIKAGIVEIPDVLVIGKADLGAAAGRTKAELEAALRHGGSGAGWQPPVLAVSAAKGEGIETLLAALDRHAAWLGSAARLARQRRAQGLAWLEAAILDRHGRYGLERAAATLRLARADPAGSPFDWQERIDQQLRGADPPAATSPAAAGPD